MNNFSAISRPEQVTFD